MGLKIKLSLILICFLFTANPFSVQAADSGGDLLKQYIAELQKNPNDNALREKIIKHVQTMELRPQVPQEAKRPFMKGVTFQKEATSVSDYELAISAYKEALLLAPWWPEAIYNMALAQEGAGKFDDAIQSLKLYLLTGPKDAEQAENRMYAMEAKKEKAAQDTSPAAQEAKRKKEFEEWLKKLDRGRWDGEFWGTHQCYSLFLEINGNKFVAKQFVKRVWPGIPCHMNPYLGWVSPSNIFEGTITGHEFPLWDGYTKEVSRGKAIISKDGQTITLYHLGDDGSQNQYIFSQTR